MNKTKIPWTEMTFNPVVGCTKYSAGCAHCYAETMARRLQGMGLEKYKNGFQVTLHPEVLDEPKRIKKPTMFFVCSMGDLFHKDVPFAFIDKVMDVIRECPQHTFQILTKRAYTMRSYFDARPVPQNVWLGVSVENQENRNRIDILRTITKAPVHFLSCEPLLDDLWTLDLNGIDWVIAGGESGNQARPMKKEWVLKIKRQCEEQGVPFFFKQWGTWGEDGIKRNAKANGHLLDGKEYFAWPKQYKLKNEQS